MKKLWTIIPIVGVLLFGCSNNGGQTDKNTVDEQEASARPLKGEVLATKLEIPWSINKLEDIFYLSERRGTITKVDSGEQTRQKVMLEKPLSLASEAGLLGLVLAPDFEETGRAFGYYTYEDNGQFNRIIELILADDQWRETKVLLDQIPSGNFHHGGRLAIGPDGKLYATAGDASEPELAQNLESLGGKILRLNLDGSVPEDNPFDGSYVYSYGHRNPQGLAWAEDGTMYASEHGPNAHDEINLIEAGRNYGWPKIIGDDSQEGLVTPLFQSGDETWAPSGLAAYDGKLYVATLRGNAVREFNLETKETREVVSGLGRIRDARVEGDQLYFISNNTDGRGTPQENDDKLYRMSLSSLD